MRTPAADRAGYGVPVLRQKEHTVKKDMPPVLAPADGADADRTRNTGHAMPDRSR